MRLPKRRIARGVLLRAATTGPQIWNARVLTSMCAECSNFHVRATLVIDDALFRELKRRAVEQDRTLSDVTQDALRRGLAVGTPPRRQKPRRLVAFAMGRPRVDLADRNQLYDVLDRS